MYVLGYSRRIFVPDNITKYTLSKKWEGAPAKYTY